MKIQLINTEKSAKNLLFVLIAIEILFVFLYYMILKIDNPPLLFKNLFHLDYEETVPSFFSAAQLLIIGITYFSMLPIVRLKKFTTVSFLIVVGLSFTFLAMDEYFMLHEKFADNFRNVKFLPRFSHGHGVWILPYILLVILLLLFISKGIIAILKNKFRECIIISLGLGIFILGAVGLEIIGYQYLRYNESFHRFYIYEIILEEFWEMLGMSIVLYGSLLIKIRK